MPQGLLCDVHGVLYTHPRAIPGSVDAVRRLRAANFPVLFLTNSTQFPKRHVVETLAGAGFPIAGEHVMTAVEAAGTWLRERGARRAGWLVNPAVAEDLPEIEAVAPEESAPGVDAVVVGDIGAGFTYAVLNRAFRWLQDGAMLLALARNRFYQGPGGLTLDAGPFVRLLEEAAGVEASVAGKPSPAFFTAGLQRLGLAASRTAMAGDDYEFDVLPAMNLGLTGIQVQTGKFREEAYARVERPADLLVENLAAAADHLLAGF